nr:DNA replication/repair protein RecF [bacterium]
MRLTRLELQNFRTYAALELELEGGVSVFTGENAQGKTNLLEAIYLCCVGRSHRTAHDAEMIREGAGEGRVRVCYQALQGAGEIEMQLRAVGRKTVLVDGVPTRRAGELYGHLNAVLFSPEDLGLVKDGPAARRKYVDVAISQVRPGYFYQLQQYTRALAQRNALLMSYDGVSAWAQDTLWAWDEQLIAAGAAIMARRKVFIGQLAEQAAQLHAGISAGRESLKVQYAPHIGWTQDGGEAEAFRAALLSARAADMARKTTTVGPHRDDLGLSIDGRDARVYASQGQQRTVALALKMAELALLRQESGDWPLLLLDDVMSELDVTRQRALLTYLPQVQTLVTGTHLPELAGFPGRAHYRVSGGTVARE